MANAAQNYGDMQTTHITDQSVQNSKFSCKSKNILVALGIIVLIGSLIASGCLYLHIGYASLAIGGSGLVISIACFLLAQYCCRRPTVTQSSSTAKSSLKPAIITPHHLGQNEIKQEKETNNQLFNKTQTREKAKLLTQQTLEPSLKPTTITPHHHGQYEVKPTEQTKYQNAKKIQPGDKAQQNSQKEDNCVDIEKDAPRFFFKDSEQHVVKSITSLIDEKVHEYITEDAVICNLIPHVKEKGFQLLSDKILEHPQLDGWILKGGGKRRWSWVGNDARTTSPNDYDNIMRVFMAERMSEAIEENGLDIFIPEKRLFAIPSDQPIPPTHLHKKYLVFSKKIDILDEPDTNETLRSLSQERQRKVARDICLLIKKTGFVDAHLGNIRWCPSLQRVAIIDTESQGLLIEKNDKSPNQRHTIKQSALIGLQELKERVVKELPIFAEEATKAMQELS